MGLSTLSNIGAWVRWPFILPKYIGIC